jgi:hypothetical protein
MDAISYSHSVKQEKRIKKFIADPDSNSGIVTVPKVIGAGDSVTIPSGRVALLHNIQVDGEIMIEGDGELFIPGGAFVIPSSIKLKAPNSTIWELSVDNLGNLITTEVI